MNERTDCTPFLHLVRRESRGWIKFNSITHSTEAISHSDFQKIKELPSTRVITKEPVDGAMSAPIKMFLSVSNKCNLTCKHCFSDSSPGGQSEPALSEIIDLIDEAAEWGVFLFVIGGGEPLIRHDIYRIIHAIRRHGMGVSLTTNGLKVSRYDIDQLTRLNVRMNISVDGAESSHDRIRGLNGAFKRTVANVEKLRDAGLKPTVRFTLMQSNINELDEVISLCSSLSVPLKVRRGKPSGRIDDSNELILSMTDEYAKALVLLNEAESCGIEDIMSFDWTERDDLLTSSNDCGAGTRVMFVDESLRMSPCVFLGPDFNSSVRWNGQDSGLKETWTRGHGFVKARNLPGNSECDSCARHRTCHSECPAMRMAATGSYGGMDPSCPKPVLLNLGRFSGGSKSV